MLTKDISGELRAISNDDLAELDLELDVTEPLADHGLTGALADLDLGLSPWTMNRYGFAGGNPISLIELDGHTTILGPDGGPSRPRPDNSAIQCPREECGRSGPPGGPPNGPPNGPPGGSSGFGADDLALSELDPKDFYVRSVLCGTDELGEALTGGTDALAGTGDKANQLGYLHQVCGLNTWQTTVIPRQSINGQLVLTPGIIPGASFMGGGDGGGSGGPKAKTGRDIVEETARGIAAKGWDHILSLMTPEMRETLRAKPFLLKAFAGTVVHDETARILRAKYGNRFAYHRKGEYDFTDTVNPLGEKIELATNKGKARDWAYQQFYNPDLQYATYDLPSGLPSNFP
jgi:hypothetical protein